MMKRKEYDPFPGSGGSHRRRLFFRIVNPGSYRGVRSEGSDQVGYINADGTEQGFIDFSAFDVPGQVGWSPGYVFSDGRRIQIFSIEEGLCHLETTRTHLWIYDTEKGRLSPIAHKHRRAPYMTFVGALPGEERIIVAYHREGENRHVIVNLDGSNPYDIPLPRDGFSYGLNLSPDASKVVFHTASKRGGYRISVMNLDGSGLVEIAGHPDHLFFGPSWSPDGEWILFTDCLHRGDPEHHRADLWISRPDGSESRKITHEQRFWLGAVYGGPATQGGGSNLSRWSPDGSTVTYIRLLPGAETAWPMKTHIDVDDHFNREYVPERARGGTEICLLDPFRGDILPLTKSNPPVWDFRATWSPDGRQIAFCRSAVGCPSDLWVMEADGNDPRFLTRGHHETGVDHPLWLIA